MRAKQITQIISAVTAAVIAVSAMGLTAFAESSGVKINKKNFPDKYFRSYVSDHFDSNYDGRLSKDEAESVTRIQVIRQSTKSLKGIEYFTELEELLCHRLSIESIDLSQNTKLVELSCEKNSITSLDISGCTELKYLDCRKNKLTELDLSNNKKLVTLSCSENQLDKLDIRNNPELTMLKCSFNGLEKLDISKNKKLRSLTCSYNSLTKLDLSKHTKLEFIECEYNQIESLDVRKSKKLNSLDCANNLLRELNLSNNPELKKLWCSGNELTSIDLTKNPYMKFSLEYTSLFECRDNGFSIPVKVGDVYSLSELQKYGLDTERMYALKGAEYDKKTQSIKITEKKVTYMYDCGYDRKAKFTLFPKS